MGKKNSFGKLCDKLEAEYILGENEIVFVKKYITQEVGEDLDMLLKIKAEAQESDYMSYASFRVAALAMVISVVGVVKQFTPSTGRDIFDLLINVFYLGAMIFSTVKILLSDTCKSMGRWRKYVLIVVEGRINELEKEIKKKSKKRGKKE